MKQIIILCKVAVGGLLLILVFFMQTSYANEATFNKANFKNHAVSAEVNKLPILVLFSSIYCDYCNFIKDEFLLPMRKSGEYSERVIITVVEDDEGDDVIDFNGDEIDAGDFSERYSINFTPTIIFIDSHGNEVSQRIIGLGNVEFFGGDLDEGIKTGLNEIKTQNMAIK